MIIKIKKILPDAKEPRNAYKNDAGYDLYAATGPVIKDSYIEYDTGISIEPSKGYHTNIFPRSSISDTDLVLANSVGLVDNGYRNTIKVRFKVVPRIILDENNKFSLSQDTPKIYAKGDKIAQLVVVQTTEVDFQTVEELDESERNQNGFGSSGK